MFKKKGFDSKKYLKFQTKAIFERLGFYKRLYLEVGGQLFYDRHASRVLPGYDPKLKIKLIKGLKDFEVIYCVNSEDLDSKRVFSNFNLNSYSQTLKDLEDLRKSSIKVGYVVLTFFSNQEKALKLAKFLEKKGILVFFSSRIPKYGEGASYAIRGFKDQSYIPVKKKIVVVTGPGGGSGKMAVCLNQLYFERKRGFDSGFSKLETFPVWNLPLNHPINLAYEAATADLGDKNFLDKDFEKKHGIKAVNYNRDIDNFKILKKIMPFLRKKKVKFIFDSVTEMGVNMVKEGIVEGEICFNAALKEIKRREKFYLENYKLGKAKKKTVLRMKEIMKKFDSLY